MTLRRLPLSPGRRIVGDLSWLSLRVPRCVMTARLAWPRALAARAAAPAPRIPWPVIVAKGFALAAETRPVLRHLHVTLPRPGLIEVPHAIGCIVLERTHEGAQMLGVTRHVWLHQTALPAVAARLARAKHGPATETSELRRLLRFVRLPWPLRRAMLRGALAFGTPMLRYGGTFAVSAIGDRHTSIIDSIGVLACFVSYGPIAADGGVDVYLAFDHRVLDGAAAADALQGLQAAIEGPVAAELEALGHAG